MEHSSKEKTCKSSIKSHDYLKAFNKTVKRSIETIKKKVSDNNED